ncbi:alpha/beta hydrolase family protein [Streptomyces zagrosensis]|uniref:Dienelactone hydrolase n=1 Tax=Streptomyces zagrosensis TaxID=1042984 RepID=A0A7W9Q716_9ACTN|nr:alpha/beta hydrolase [Streptomyces zagrosensis]MBB5933912.1 dienelactone hydrolase [Streptomyces zagrosensis]
MSRIRRTSAALVLSLALALPLSTAYASAAAPQSAASAPSARTAAAQAISSRTAAPAADTQLRIPRLSGPYAVGRNVRHLVDHTRQDPWVPSAQRELMVSVYYPARPAHPARLDGGGSGKARAPYMSIEEVRLFLQGKKLDAVLDAEQVSATRTHARTDARPARGTHPLLVLSPGFTLPRATLTLLSEDLASRGYVVALLDHAYETFGTTFPGGRVLTCRACEVVEQEPTDAAEKRRMGEAAEDRAADISFVIDELKRRHPVSGQPARWQHSAMIDFSRIGAAGHSIGGNAAAYAMSVDHRIRAGVNMDGSFFAPVPRSGLGARPFLMLGTETDHAPNGADTTWPRDWARLDGWKRWLTVRGAGHFSFLDLPVLGAQLGITDPTAPLPGRRAGKITTAYVGAFFDQHLRGVHQRLLTGPSHAHPEVTFRNP